MTYATDVDSYRHRVGFYFKFRGIPTRLSTHDPADWPNWSTSETFLPVVIRDSISGFSESLNRKNSFVDGGSLSWEVMATDAVVSLMARRGGTEDTLSAAVSPSATSWTIVDDNLPTSGVVYCDRETLNITASGAGTRTVTRGYQDSRAVPHAVGAIISTQPRFWFTRRFTLFAVNLETGTETEVFTGTLSETPPFDSGKFSFSGESLINDFLKKPLHTGFREVQSSAPVEVKLGGSIEITCADTTGLLSPGYMRVTGQSGSAIAGGFILGLSPGLSSTAITLSDWSYIAGSPTSLALFEGENVSVEQVTVVTGKPSRVALYTILSVEGDGSNDSEYDSLVGQRADATGSDELFRDLRMGAGIDASDVNIVSFRGIHGDYNIAAWLDEETSLGDFLAQEVLFRSGGYVYTTPAGVLSHKQYTSNTVRSGLDSYTYADLLSSNVASVDDETGGLARVVFECNYRPTTREYLRKVELVFRDENALYGDVGESLSLQSKSINVGGTLSGIAATHLFSAPMSLLELESSFDRQRARQSWAGRRRSFRLPWKHHNTFLIGYRFSFTDPRDVDHEGGTGVSGRYYEVTGRNVDVMNGELSVDVDEVPRGWAIAPSAFISSWDGGTLTATLDTSTDLHDSSPGLDFAKDWSVKVYDASADFGAVDTVGIASVTSSTITFTSTPSLSGGAGPAAGDLIVLSESDDTGETNDVGADVEDFAFAADSGYTVGTSSKAGPRWS